MPTRDGRSYTVRPPLRRVKMRRGPGLDRLIERIREGDGRLETEIRELQIKADRTPKVGMDENSLRETHRKNEEWLEEHRDTVLGHGIIPENVDLGDLLDEHERRVDENRRIERYLDDV